MGTRKSAESSKLGRESFYLVARDAIASANRCTITVPNDDDKDNNHDDDEEAADHEMKLIDLCL